MFTARVRGLGIALAFLLFVVAGSIFLYTRWVKTPKGRAKMDAIILKLPMIGSLVRMIAVARFSRTLGTLLSSGVALLVALDIVRRPKATPVHELERYAARTARRCAAIRTNGAIWSRCGQPRSRRAIRPRRGGRESGDV